MRSKRRAMKWWAVWDYDGILKDGKPAQRMNQRGYMKRVPKPNDVPRILVREVIE